MTSKDIQKVVSRTDRKIAALPKDADFSSHSFYRIQLEIAYQLALLNEKADHFVPERTP